jgi:alkylation response protein AidB-like acyl-CoA dehydrogenase
VARDYALTREQFNVPIGSFQALKHLMADMFVRAELARSATYAAASVIDNPRVGDPERAVRIAKVLAGEAALANSRAAVQILGGMGFTWAMPPHFLLKRSWVLESSFGTTEDHARPLGADLEHLVT